MYSPSINNLIEQLKKLPSVGQHTAERFVFYWLKSGKKNVQGLVTALQELLQTVKSCETCWNFSDTNPCTICGSPRRDRTTLAVVALPQDLAALENTHEFKGVYHVLRGVLDVSDPDNLPETKIPVLLARVAATQSSSQKFAEIILGLNPDLRGETTMLYLRKELKKIDPGLKVTRLARGLPMGSDMQYADEITLGSALKERVEK